MRPAGERHPKPCLRFERHRKTVRKIRELLKRKRARKRNRLVVKVEATGPAGGTAKTRKRIKLKR
jgi:hypothetical protein